jgi:hypothetical protein
MPSKFRRLIGEITRPSGLSFETRNQDALLLFNTEIIGTRNLAREKHGEGDHLKVACLSI